MSSWIFCKVMLPALHLIVHHEAIAVQMVTGAISHCGYAHSGYAYFQGYLHFTPLYMHVSVWYHSTCTSTFSSSVRFLWLQSPLVFHRKLKQELTLCIILYCIVYVISYRHKAKPISRHVCRFNTVPANYVESPCCFQHFALQLVEIYTSVKIRPLTLFRKPRRNPWKTLKSTSTFVQSQADFFIGSADFLLLSQMLCGAFA